MDDTLRAAAQALRNELDARAAFIKDLPVMTQVLKLHSALNALEALMEEPRTTLAQLFGMENAEAPAPIRSDEFYGLAPLDAAKRYLKKRGEARPFTEILEAIQTGGGRVDAPEDLRLSLSRSTYEVAKVGDDLYGLVEFYPHLKRERGKKKRGASEAADAEIAQEDEQREVAEFERALAEGADDKK